MIARYVCVLFKRRDVYVLGATATTTALCVGENCAMKRTILVELGKRYR